MLLAGDVGGTKTALGIFSQESGPRAPLAHASYSSGDGESLVALVRRFLGSTDLPIDRACFAVAGPVLDGRTKITNLSWVIDERGLAEELGLESVRLINDLEAIARAIPTLTPGDLHTLNHGTPADGGAIAVIAPGTGLGEAFLTWDSFRYIPHPSEGGHGDFAPTTTLEIGLLQDLRRQCDHVSVERVCSGPGIIRIYDYLRRAGHFISSRETAALIVNAADPAAMITQAGLRRPTPDPLSRAALEMFVSILGAEAGNLALRVLATGGVYLAGGIPPRLVPVLDEGRFLQSFVRKRRLADLLTNLPIHVVLTRSAILGAVLFDFGSATSGPPALFVT
jgi:glucokinase